MGHIRHHAIIVTTDTESNLLEGCRNYAESIGCSVSPVVQSGINAMRSFCVFPDGSKEGWIASNDGDLARAKIISCLEESRYNDGSSPLSWVEVQYGDDAGQTKIVRDSDEHKRA